MTTNQLVCTFQMLPPDEQAIIYALMRRLIPDDVVTDDDIAAHNMAMEEFRRGETIKHDDVDWS